MKYFEIVEKFKRTQAQIIELDQEYENKKKGDAYQKRKIQLIQKLDDYKRLAMNLGTRFNICHISGKRQRPSRKNPQVLVTENFNLYFTNIDENEASGLVKLHVKNAISYKITFYKPGVIMTTS